MFESGGSSKAGALFFFAKKIALFSLRIKKPFYLYRIEHEGNMKNSLTTQELQEVVNDLKSRIAKTQLRARLSKGTADAVRLQNRAATLKAELAEVRQLIKAAKA